ncbi:MAG: hypothetical protein KKB51_15965 [Candidatus Riflebacteria bacterium]|nr:hypothetical protein [Candidatus Riflebacteria bacterium]
MPIVRSSLQNDQILHTRCENVLTDEDLITYYRDFFADGLQEKYFLELIDGSRITEFAITQFSQIKLKDIVEDFFGKLTQDIQYLSSEGADPTKIEENYSRILTNTFCNPQVANLLGLKKNQKISSPPKDRITVVNVLKFYLEALMSRKVAMFSDLEPVFEVFIQWEQARRHLGYPIAVFRDISSASVWLLC